jgi:3-oxoacyl-[acyl-carrier-protein] synthase II
VTNTAADNLSPTKKALLALQKMQQKIDALEQRKHEPIAIIGIGCRFPGSNNPEEFWQLLVEGKNAITKVPPQHWDLEQYCNDGVNTPGKICNGYGGFVPHLKEFDATFFRIAPREAMSLDPQQRLLLEVSWEALENAGIPAEELQGSATGVFIGICGTDYWHQLLSRNPTQIDAYLTIGNTHSLASGRLSHFYGLTAPSISIDTACSSSLVAVHLAIKSLRDRESNLAIVGGVNRLIAPQVSINFSQAKMLSPDGLCKTFDDSADGFVRSEGCGIVILKRFSDAIADKDNIQAVLWGSAVNQDGRTSSITTPNSLSQQAVIQQALQNSRIEPQQVSYLESHGTGTSLGDLIEIEALSSVFGQNKQLMIGAVKTNIGHLESASGIASLIKTVLVLQNNTIPANLHLKQANKQINWQNLPFTLPQNNLPWQKTEQPRFAGVSAFGFSGTNAHIIVSEVATKERSQALKTVIRADSNLFTLSAKNEPALRQLATDYVEYLQKNSDLNLEDICLTINLGRSHFSYRLALTATSIRELQTKLRQFSNRETPEKFWQGKANLNHQPQVKVNHSGDTQTHLLELAESMLVNPSLNLDTAEIHWLIGDRSILQPENQAKVIFTKIDRELSDWQLLTSGLAQLYILGVALNWNAIAKNFSGEKIALPTYPFQQQTYWLD